MRTPFVVLDAMGVIYTARDDVAELLIPFARSMGCVLDDRTIAAAYVECSLGRSTSMELWRTLGLHGDLNAVEDRYLGLHRVTPGLVEFLEAMEAQRLSVACLSNDVSEWSLDLRRRHGLERRIEPWVISGDVGARKPDAAIFTTFLERAGRTAEECVFVDDRVANLDTARALGFRTAHFSDGDEGTNDHPVVGSFTELERWISG